MTPAKLQKVIERQTNAIRTAIPGVLRSYDPDTQSATVEVSVCEKEYKGRAEFPSDYCVPPLSGVPVLFFGTSSALVYAEPQPGDTGLLIIAHRSIAEWKAAAARGTAGVEAADTRRFDYSDAIFIPGVRPFADAYPDEWKVSDALVLHHENEIRAGAAATKAVALAPEVQAELNALKAAVSTAVAAVLTAIPGQPAFTIFEGAFSYSAGSVASSKLKAE